MKKADKYMNFILPIMAVLSIFVVWLVASQIIDSVYILPSVKETFLALWNLLKDKAFYVAFLMTILRSLIAFFISFFVASILAFLSYKFIYAKKFIAPIISIIRTLPTVAVILLLVLWSKSYVAAVVVTILVVLPTTFTSVSNILTSLDKDILEMCKVFNISKKDKLFKVYLPYFAPNILIVIGSGIALNLKLMVASEVLSHTAQSIGYLIYTSKISFEVPTMFALVLVTVITGVIIESVFNLLSKKAGKWL